MSHSHKSRAVSVETFFSSFFLDSFSTYICLFSVYQGFPIFIGPCSFQSFQSCYAFQLLSSSFIILRMRLLARNVVVDG
jgi:hypothetical protein